MPVTEEHQVNEHQATLSPDTTGISQLHQDEGDSPRLFEYFSPAPDIVPECKAYGELLSYERKLDDCLKRNRLELDQILYNAPTVQRRLRINVSSQFYQNGIPSGSCDGDGKLFAGTPGWELRVEGRLMSSAVDDTVDSALKFSSFFNSVVIELDRALYGPDSHLVEWNRTLQSVETDGFQVRRPGDQDVKCSIILTVLNQANQYRMDSRLGRILGYSGDSLHQSRCNIIKAFWFYVKKKKLQDPVEPDLIIPNQHIAQLFESNARVRLVDIPFKLSRFLYPPEPCVINFKVVTPRCAPSDQMDLLDQINAVETSSKRATFYVMVEMESAKKKQANIFLEKFLCENRQLTRVQRRIDLIVSQIDQMRARRNFFTEFAKDPQRFIDRWLASQCRDLKHISDSYVDSLELDDEERRASYFTDDHVWLQEAIARYVHSRIDMYRRDLERTIGLQ